MRDWHVRTVHLVAVPPPTPLSEFFRLFKPTYVLGTTYTLSLAFFESQVWPLIDRSALRYCLILADSHGFRSSLVEATALRGVGRDYLAACVPVTGTAAFHPKVWVLVAEDAMAVLAGSGNLTRSGFLDNAELFDAVHLRAGGPHRAVAEGVLAFLDGLRGHWPGGGEGRLVTETVTQVRSAVAAVAATMPVDPNPTVRFLSSYQGPLVEQLAGPLGGGTLYAAAPYFGGSTAGVEDLHAHLAPKRLKVFPAVHGGGEVDVQLEELNTLPRVSAHRLALGGRRFAHLKLFAGDGPNGRWLFTTSANCTRAALVGPNVEAGLLRAVGPGEVEPYFAEAKGALPTIRRANTFHTAGRWLPMAATDRGAAVEIRAGGGHDLLPLHDVEVVFAVDGDTARVHRDRLFETAASALLSFDLFSNAAGRTRAAVLITVRGRTAGGETVEGAAFLDLPLHLASDPSHRGAWRAALALLDAEGMPDAADLACVFHLFDGVFDSPDRLPDESQRATATPGQPAPTADEDRLALWPPVTGEEVPGGFLRGTSHPVQWFQAILTDLLVQPEGEPTPRTTSGATTTDSEDDDEGVEVPTTLSRAAATVWEQAAGSFDQLLDRMVKVEPTERTAKRVWPVAVAVLLVTLATRRQLARLPGGDELPTAGDLVTRFLWAAFSNREQPWRGSLNDASGRPTHPPIVTELCETWDVSPSADLADVLRLLFAYQHARGKRGSAAFSLDGWLAFRDIAPTAGQDTTAGERLFHRFLGGDVSWAEVVVSLAELPTLDWSAHPGYRELCKFAGWEMGEPVPPGEPLRGRWEQNRRWVRKGQPWWMEVTDRFRPCCPARGCAKQHQVDRDKLPLADHRPVICGGCGVVLVTARLLREYEGRHVHPA